MRRHICPHQTETISLSQREPGNQTDTLSGDPKDISSLNDTSANLPSSDTLPEPRTPLSTQERAPAMDFIQHPLTSIQMSSPSSNTEYNHSISHYSETTKHQHKGMRRSNSFPIAKASPDKQTAVPGNFFNDRERRSSLISTQETTDNTQIQSLVTVTSNSSSQESLPGQQQRKRQNTIDQTLPATFTRMEDSPPKKKSTHPGKQLMDPPPQEQLNAMEVVPVITKAGYRSTRKYPGWSTRKDPIAAISDTTEFLMGNKPDIEQPDLTHAGADKGETIVNLQSSGPLSNTQDGNIVSSTLAKEPQPKSTQKQTGNHQIQISLADNLIIPDSQACRLEQQQEKRRKTTDSQTVSQRLQLTNQPPSYSADQPDCTPDTTEDLMRNMPSVEDPGLTQVGIEENGIMESLHISRSHYNIYDDKFLFPLGVSHLLRNPITPTDNRSLSPTSDTSTHNPGNRTGSQSPTSQEQPWMLTPWLHEACQLVEQHLNFFKEAIPFKIPKFLHSIPTDDSSLLPIFSDIVVTIVKAIQTAPSERHATLPWILFFWLPHLVLGEKDMPSFTNGSHSKTDPNLSPKQRQASHLKENMIRLTSNAESLFTNLLKTSWNYKTTEGESTNRTPTQFDPSILSKQQQKEAKKAFRNGHFSKAMQIIRGDALPQSPVQTDEDLCKVCQKYFHTYPADALPILEILNPSLRRWPDNAPDLVSADNLEKGIKNLSDTASGISGWSAAILKQVFPLNPHTKAVILFVVRQLARNNIPPIIAKFITAFQLTLLQKPNLSIRPISVGDLFMRLTSSILLQNIMPQIKILLRPTQLGLGTKGACEVANTINTLICEFLPILRSNPVMPERLQRIASLDHTFSFFMDLRNCFGLISLDTFALILNKYPKLQSIGPYFALQYGSQSHMFFSFSKARELLLAQNQAENGAFQGEGLATFCSCIVLIHVLTEALEGFTPEEILLIIIASIIDDMTIHAPAKLMISFVTKIHQQLKKLQTGEINTSKSFLLFSADVPSCPPLSEYLSLAEELTTVVNGEPIPIDDDRHIKVKIDGAVSLGIPQGSGAFKEAHLEALAKDVVFTINRLTQIPDKQMQYHLVKYCISGIPTSILRQVPPSLTISHLVEPIQDATLSWFQQMLSESVAIPHPPINELSKLIAASRCSAGGLGLPLQHHLIAPLAYLTATITACTTIREIYATEDPTKCLILILVDELLRPFDQETDEHLLPMCAIRDDLLKGLAQFVALKGLPPHTSLQDLSMAPINQAMATTAISAQNKVLIDSALTNDLDRAQFLSQQAVGAACVFMAPPTIAEFSMPSDEFAALLAVRTFSRLDPLGFPIPSDYPQLQGHPFENIFKCPFCKHQGATLSYEHILVCPGGSENIARHNECSDLFIKLLNLAGIYNTIREPSSVSAGTKKRTDILAWLNALMQRAYDFAVVSPNVPTYALTAARKQLHAASSKFTTKMGKHGPAHKAAIPPIDFCPMVLESTGAFHGRALLEIEALVARAGPEAFPPHNAPGITDAFQYWVHVISIAAVRATMRKLVLARQRARRDIANYIKQHG